MIITSLILSVLALALSMWIGRKNPVRSSGLTAGMLVLLMLTPLLMWMPKIPLDIGASLPWINAALPSHAVSPVSESLSNSSWNVMIIALGIYGFVFALLLTRLVSHYLVTRRWCHAAVPCDDPVSIKLLEDCAQQLDLAKLPEVRFSEFVDSPVITGLVNPMLLLPTHAASWNTETLKMVMLHELGHVQRRDLWTSLAAQIACALHWFNPLVWILRKRLTHECEYACDAHVIFSGAQPEQYINALCDVAEACHDRKLHHTGHVLGFSAALSMANQASLKNRVVNLIEKTPEVNRINSIIVIAVLSISASATLAINLVSPDVATPTNDSDNKDKALSISTPVPMKEVNLRLSANPFPGDE